MPIQTPIVNSVLPKEVEKPIPTRTVSTRPVPKSMPGGDQVNIDKGPSSSAAESAPPAESVKLSPQLSALARKEQEYRKKLQALEVREKSNEARLVDADKFLKLQERFKAKDYSVFEENGLEYEGYTNYLLNKQGQDPQKQEMQKLADEMANLKKSQEDKEKEELESTLKEYRKEIKSLVDANPDYSTVKELDRGEVALQLILDSWEEDGEELSIEQALKEVEDFSVDEAKKFSQISKLKPKEEAAPVVEEKKPLPKPALKTITNETNVGAQDSAVPKKSLQHMSDEERYLEARRRVLARKQAQ